MMLGLVWTVLAGLFILTPAAGQESAPCADVLFIGARGSGQLVGEAGGFGGEVDALRRRLEAKLTKLGLTMQSLPLVDYSAQGIETLALDAITLNSRFFAGVDKGRVEMVAAIHRSRLLCGPQQRVVLSGFSQGAMVVHLTLNALEREDRAHVSAAVMLSDPLRVARSSIDRGDASNGRNGVGQVVLRRKDVPKDVRDRVWSYCYKGDIVCDYNPLNLFSTAVHTDTYGGRPARLGARRIAGALTPTCKGVTATLARFVRRTEPLVGTRGADVIVGTSGDDVIRGRGGRDRICGRGGDDYIAGGSGRDRIWGGTGNDTLLGGKQADRIWGQSGADNIKGNRGDDYLHGGVGSDIIEGGTGEDTIFGRAGDDRLYGGPQSDRLLGGAGDDRLRGQGGRDTLDGGAGTDSCKGGPGRDTKRRCERARQARDVQWHGSWTCGSGGCFGSPTVWTTSLDEALGHVQAWAAAEFDMLVWPSGVVLPDAAFELRDWFQHLALTRPVCQRVAGPRIRCSGNDEDGSNYFVSFPMEWTRLAGTSQDVGDWDRGTVWMAHGYETDLTIPGRTFRFEMTEPEYLAGLPAPVADTVVRLLQAVREDDGDVALSYLGSSAGYFEGLHDAGGLLPAIATALRATPEEFNGYYSFTNGDWFLQLDSQGRISQLSGAE